MRQPSLCIYGFTKIWLMLNPFNLLVDEIRLPLLRYSMLRQTKEGVKIDTFFLIHPTKESIEIVKLSFAKEFGFKLKGPPQILSLLIIIQKSRRYILSNRYAKNENKFILLIINNLCIFSVYYIDVEMWKYSTLKCGIV